MSSHAGSGNLSTASKAQHRTERVHGDCSDEVQSGHRGFEIRRENWCALNGIDSREKRVIKERFGVDYHERHVGTILKRLGFSHMSARPRHPAQNGEIVEAFKKTLPKP